jgi:hypothetical protein
LSIFIITPVRRLQRELDAAQAVDVRAAQHHVAAGQQRVERRRAQVRGDGLERLDRQQRDGCVQMGRLAVEAVADDALARHQPDLVEVVRRVLARAVLGPPEVVVPGRHEQVQDLDVVPVAHDGEGRRGAQGPSCLRFRAWLRPPTP